MSFVTPLSSVEPELLLELERYGIENRTASVIACLALGYEVEPDDIETPYWPVLRNGRITDEIKSIGRLERPEGFQELLEGIARQGLGFMICSLQTGEKRSYRARVFRYVANAVSDPIQVDDDSMERALCRAFAAFHQSALLWARLHKEEAPQ